MKRYQVCGRPLNTFASSLTAVNETHLMYASYMGHDDSLHAGLATFLSSLGTVRVKVHLSVKYRWKKPMSE